MQLLAYYAAIAKGTDVDQPRNLRRRASRWNKGCKNPSGVILALSWAAYKVAPWPIKNDLKRAVAAKALDYVQDGMKLGLGSGSTAEIFVEMLAPRVRGGEKLRCVPTSERTADAGPQAGH